MKSLFVLIVLSIFNFNFLCGQTGPKASIDLLKKLDYVLQQSKAFQADDSFVLIYNKIRKFEKLKAMESDSLSEKQEAYIYKNDSILEKYKFLKDVHELIYELETENYHQSQLTPESYKILESFTKLRYLSALLTINQGFSFADSPHQQFIQKKLIHAISVQMQTMAENTTPLYNYQTVEKKWFKGMQIEHANDLLTFGVLQDNNDMDYTGALRVSMITDMLKVDLFAPSQSYQVLTYGADVYTPYFKDTAIFIADTSTNVFDRPHGCFQYIGLENHATGKFHKHRRTLNIRLGIIGSRFGYNFQYYLHRDLSVSPAPVGWDAQIGYPGRLAAQVDFRYERLILGDQSEPAASHKMRVVPMVIGGVAAGHFNTHGEIGFNLSTHNFREKNQMNIVAKSYQTKYTQTVKKAVFYADYNFIVRGVLHNAMLDGFGLFISGEENERAFAQQSKYYFKKGENRTRKVVMFSNLSFGWQFSRFNIFYRYSLKSPEYRSSGTINTYNDKTRELTIINPNTRWHHYGSLGLSFVL